MQQPATRTMLEHTDCLDSLVQFYSAIFILRCASKGMPAHCAEQMHSGAHTQAWPSSPQLAPGAQHHTSVAVQLWLQNRGLRSAWALHKTPCEEEKACACALHPRPGQSTDPDIHQPPSRAAVSAHTHAVPTQGAKRAACQLAASRQTAPHPPIASRARSQAIAALPAIKSCIRSGWTHRASFMQRLPASQIPVRACS
jgi:hypothetical protein